MANEEHNKNENADSILGLESDSLEELGKISAEELEKFGSELKDFNDEPKPKAEQAEEAEKPAEKPAETADADKKEAVTLADIIDDKKDKSAEGRQGADGRPTGPNGQRRRRPNGQNGQRRPRPDGQRPGPDGQRPRPNGKRPRPNGQRPRPNGADPALRRRPNPAGERPDGEENAEGKKKGWTKKKKAVLITVVTIVLTLALIVAVILILFFSYTGKLNRDLDTRTNSGEYRIDSSELVSKPDTINKEDELKKQKDLLAKKSKPITDSNVMNILIVGEDLRDTEPDPETGENPRGNTDVQLLVSINKQTKKIVLASFLRDQYLNIDGYGMGRLNVAYWKNGIPLLSETISNYYSVHIDRYVLVNFYSFIDVVDEIGGLDMDVDNDEFAAINEAVREHNKYLKNPPEKDYVKQPGKQHLNGNQALAYARIRQGCGDDYGRTERQRETITAIINKMKSLNLLELSYLIDKVAPQITTDISDGEIASLILDASEIMNYQICQVQMPTLPYFTEEVINQMAVLVPDYDKCTTVLLDMIYSDSKTAEDSIKKIDAGTINQYTYTQGGDQQLQQQQQQQPQENVLNNDQQQQQQQQQYYY